MKTIDQFAKQAPGNKAETRIGETVALIEYLNEVSILRPYFKKIDMGDDRIRVITVTQQEGIAAQIIGNAEVPRSRDVDKEIYIRLRRNASGYDVTYDELRENKGNPGFERDLYNRALERLYLKERADMVNVLVAGAGSGTTVSTNVFDIDTIRDAVTDFNSQPYNIKTNAVADTIFLSEKALRTLESSDNYKIVPSMYEKRITQGSIGARVEGLDTVIVPELGDVLVIAAVKKEPLWLAEGSGTIISKYSNPKYLTESTDFRHDQESLCAESRYLTSITLVSPVVPETPKRSIAVTVTDGTDPVGSASVTLVNKDDISDTYTGTTDASGKCTIADVPDGVYTYAASAAGFSNFSSSTDLTVSESSITLSITMTSS